MTRTRAIHLPQWAGEPIEKEIDGWPVVTGFKLAVPNAKVFIADLGHRPMAMVHGDNVPKLGSCGPGKVVQMETGLAGVLSPGEAVVFDLTGPLVPQWPEGNYTDISEGYLMLGLWGSQSLAVLQRLVAVDVERPDLDEPLFLGTRSHDIFIYVINFKKKTPGFLLACSRPDAQFFFDGIVHVGKPLGLKLEGTEAFEYFLNF